MNTEKRKYLKQYSRATDASCVLCYQRLPLQDFYPEITGFCRQCCEQVWERMQRTARENPDECLRIASRDLCYWRGYAARDHVEYKLIRRKRMEFANHRCENCGTKDRLSMHHLTYVRIFNELLDDVRILCVSCHAKADAVRRRQEKESSSIPSLLLKAMTEEKRLRKLLPKSVRK